MQKKKRKKKRLVIASHTAACVRFFFFFLFSIQQVRKIEKDSGKQLFWAESLVLTFFMAFGGGILAPFLLGKPPVMFVNDLLVPVVSHTEELDEYILLYIYIIYIKRTCNGLVQVARWACGTWQAQVLPM